MIVVPGGEERQGKGTWREKEDYQREERRAVLCLMGDKRRK